MEEQIKLEIRTIGKEHKSLKKIIRGIIEWALYALVFILIVWGTPTALTKVLHTEYPIAAITSSSMWPVLKQGDIVFIQGVSSKEEVQVGNIVVYENQKGFTIHRIVKMNEDAFITKGDANNVEDDPVRYDELVGKTVNFMNKPLCIPYLGKLSKMYKK